MAEEAKWYVAHTYSGYEDKVKTDLEKTIINSHLEDKIRLVHIDVAIFADFHEVLYAYRIEHFTCALCVTYKGKVFFRIHCHNVVFVMALLALLALWGCAESAKSTNRAIGGKRILSIALATNCKASSVKFLTPCCKSVFIWCVVQM